MSEIIKQLFEKKFGVAPESITALPQSGSERVYYRVKSNDISVIGAFNSDIKENEAFFAFTETFCKHGVNVPELLAVDGNRKHYLVTDLGNETLFDRIKTIGNNRDDKLNIIKRVLLDLVKFQTSTFNDIDFSLCYPRSSFDKQSILWDLNYFKYCFLKLADIAFDEQLLENDFITLSDKLVSVPQNCFMIRDFQSRNIMINNDKIYFIDYQGGRKGPLQYDVASLLYSPKTALSSEDRDAMLQFYVDNLEQLSSDDGKKFIDTYYDFVLIRILQALGAYGYRGLFQRKANFKSSIHVAIDNLSDLSKRGLIDSRLTEIIKVIGKLASSTWAKEYTPDGNRLTIEVTSFSFRKSIPNDKTDNGGGFVFDCRGLPNPGRYTEYRRSNGTDKDVIDFLEKYPEVEKFQNLAREIVKISVEDYISRKFNHLCINFGCTGGQHRSVYNAESMAKWLKANFDVDVILLHTEKENWRH